MVPISMLIYGGDVHAASWTSLTPYLPECGANPGSGSCVYQFDNRMHRLGTSVFGDKALKYGINEGEYFKNVSQPISEIREVYTNSANKEWVYSTKSATADRKIVHPATFNGVTFGKGHTANDLYAIKDTHTSYPNRRRLNFTYPFSNDDGVELSGQILHYKFSYFIGDGGFPWHIDDKKEYVDNIPSDDPDEMHNANTDYITWFSRYDKAVYTNQSDFSWVYGTNRAFGTYIDLNYEINESGLFNNNMQFFNFLSNYSFTKYVASENKGYNMGSTSSTWTVSNNIFPVIQLMKNGNNVVDTLDTSCVIIARPYRYNYETSGGTKYYCWTYRLDFYIYGLIDDVTDFDAVNCKFNLTYAFNSNSDYSVLEVFSSYDYGILLSNSGFTNPVDDILSAISKIPVIGGILYKLFSIIINFIELFIYILSLFNTYPDWFVGGIRILLFILFVRIIFKVVNRS